MDTMTRRDTVRALSTVRHIVRVDGRAIVVMEVIEADLAA
jgi:hypothetical protein